jgi:hypothetical protein
VLRQTAIACTTVMSTAVKGAVHATCRELQVTTFGHNKMQLGSSVWVFRTFDLH